VGDRANLRGTAARHGIDAKFLVDMGEFPGVGEAAIRHHRAQRLQAPLREEQSWEPSETVGLSRLPFVARPFRVSL
jgi:hypothetical protein